ncbi:hypothetical protein FA15DRAFT_671244 [Coprinopsis marcescibilis]|uniref:Uncharacterized protein n=1 Tax=Coprinopsis marcescibilis TaxID=230819 RepID=A0A5C3L3F9_COPMA|nr:hypothetical protein FA15DRAFT_671244 [Coprinopsis marcescibilis]
MFMSKFALAMHRFAIAVCRDWDLAATSQAHLCSPITTHLAPNNANTVQSFRRLIT